MEDGEKEKEKKKKKKKKTLSAHSSITTRTTRTEKCLTSWHACVKPSHGRLVHGRKVMRSRR